MTSYWLVLACALGSYGCLRASGLDWSIGIGAALAAVAFVPLPALAVAAGSVASARTRSRRLDRGAWCSIGVDRRRRAVAIPIGGESGRHALVVGATGSGKTVTQALLVARAIARGHGAVVIDPKGDRLLRDVARDGARREGRPYWEWTPAGPTVYNPFAHGSPGEIADKALAGERYTEPHYLRQAQRYLAHVARALAASSEPATPARLLELMDPRRLELLARSAPDERHARTLFDYLDSLDGRQRAGLAGTRDRLAVLAESELGGWLTPAAGVSSLDLLEAVRERAVVYFRLDADRLPLLAGMLGAAVVSDLLTVAASCQEEPEPTLVAIDEFSAIAPTGVARLFGRARAAGFSMLLATQELADLRAAGSELLEQVLGNVETVIAHRQSVPDSAEMIARIAGTRRAWSSTEQLAHAVPTGRGTRSRSREFAIHPDVIRTLACGSAAVSVASAGRCALTRIFHP
jgi:hypothetical protein